MAYELGIPAGQGRTFCSEFHPLPFVGWIEYYFTWDSWSGPIIGGPDYNWTSTGGLAGCNYGLTNSGPLMTMHYRTCDANCENCDSTWYEEVMGNAIVYLWCIPVLGGVKWAIILTLGSFFDAYGEYYGLSAYGCPEMVNPYTNPTDSGTASVVRADPCLSPSINPPIVLPCFDCTDTYSVTINAGSSQGRSWDSQTVEFTRCGNGCQWCANNDSFTWTYNGNTYTNTNDEYDFIKIETFEFPRLWSIELYMLYPPDGGGYWIWDSDYYSTWPFRYSYLENTTGCPDGTYSDGSVVSGGSGLNAVATTFFPNCAGGYATTYSLSVPATTETSGDYSYSWGAMTIPLDRDGGNWAWLGSFGYSWDYQGGPSEIGTAQVRLEPSSCDTWILNVSLPEIGIDLQFRFASDTGCPDGSYYGGWVVS